MALVQSLDRSTKEATRQFLERVARQYDLAGAYLFGSRARGDGHVDSDADVAVLLTGTPGKRLTTALEMADIAFEVMLETGVLVEALPLWESEWERPETFGNPSLIDTIHREGVQL